jgi:hypothetical protein
MIRIELDVEDLANTRFAISPLAETVLSLRALVDPSQHTLQLPWLRAVDTRLDARDSHLLRSRVGPSLIPPDFRGIPSRALPDFLTPRPPRFAPHIEHELATIRATAPEIVRRDPLATHTPDPVPRPCNRSPAPKSPRPSRSYTRSAKPYTATGNARWHQAGPRCDSCSKPTPPTAPANSPPAARACYSPTSTPTYGEATAR